MNGYKTATVAEPAGQSAAPEKARAAAAAYAREVRASFGPRALGIRLYGSAARGDWSVDSDVDVLVLLDREEPDDMERLVKMAYRIGLTERRLLLQPVMLTAGEFQRLIDRERRFARDVVREGIAL